MAYAHQNQRRICVPVPQFFVDLRSPIPPAGFFPGSFPVVNPNPSFPHPAPPVQVLVPNTRPVIASGRYFWNPAVFIRMEEERNRSLHQVMMITFCAFSFFLSLEILWFLVLGSWFCLVFFFWWFGFLFSYIVYGGRGSGAVSGRGIEEEICDWTA